MIDRLNNLQRREAQRTQSQVAQPKVGVVTSYDPANYSAKVRLQPENVETGWLPIRAIWAGDGWGDFAPPSIGDEVEIQHQEGGKQAPYIALRAFGDEFRPLAVPSGERWIVHQTGSSVRLLNDGTIALHAPTVNITGNLNVDGTITATQDIYDLGSGAGSMQHIRATYDTHNHPNPEGGNTGVPNQPL